MFYAYTYLITLVFVRPVTNSIGGVGVRIDKNRPVNKDIVNPRKNLLNNIVFRKKFKFRTITSYRLKNEKNYD